MNDIDCDVAAEAAYREFADEQLAEQIDRLTAEIEALRKDGERWRHARMLFSIDDIEDRALDLRSFGFIASEDENVKADKAIDAAIAAMKEQAE